MEQKPQNRLKGDKTMAQISVAALQTVTAKQLQAAIRSMNKVGKNYGIKIAAKETKEAMAKAFVDAADLVAEKGGDGIDSFTKPVQKLYRALKNGPGEENATDGKSGGQIGKDKPAPKPPKRTRGSVFAEMLAKGPVPGTRKEWAARYLATYGGSEAESEFRVGVYMDLLVHMGLVTVDEKGIHAYTG
jgi:hypothetical protein